MTDTEVIEETERVSMVWPKVLKDAVREAAGDRGITEFSILAVEERLVALQDGTGAIRQQLSKENNQLHWLIQQLADRVAMGGSLEDRLQNLMELDLPDWIETAGWPKAMAEQVKPAPFEEIVKQEECATHPRSFHDVGAQCPECLREKRADPTVPVAPPAPKVETPEDLPEGLKSPVDSMLAKVMAMANEKGVDLGDIGLKRASDIPAPDPISEPTPEVVVPVELEVIEVFGEPKCPECGEELVEGECWTCE